MNKLKNNLILRAARNQPTPRTPVWLMRQAGRCDPEYRALRERANLELEAMFRDPDLSAEASLLPKRFGVDAIIIFQDILTPLAPSGAEFVFRPGPQLEKPIRGDADIDALRSFDPADELAHVGKVIRRVKGALRHELPVIGFAGAPLTLAMFLVEGKSPGRNPEYTFAMMRENSTSLHKLLSRLADITAEYLAYQIEEGVHIVQLFESMADVLTREQYESFALPYQRRIFSALGDHVPTILFAKERTELELLSSAGADVISVGNSLDLRDVRSEVGERVAVQGNVDNQILVTATTAGVREAVRKCIEAGGGRGHILNLNHGLIADTPIENVLAFVDEARGVTNNSEAVTGETAVHR